MFCDLVGSTQLSTQLDPEDLREVITIYQDACREAVDRYDGFIAKFMGDGVLVYFGYPQAHEDDANRAVRAGLDILSAVPTLNSYAMAQHGVEVAVRIGIATGPVVVGDIIGEGAAEEAAVVGETPNLAARLQGVAEPGQLTISVGTHRLVQLLFDMQDLGEHDLKGLTEPVRVWRVVAEQAEDQELSFGFEESRAPIVGRQEEMGLLLRAWEASREGRGQVVLIQGEAGIGKSRLLEALRAQLGPGHTWVAIRASPYHTASTLHPPIEHLKRVFRWQPDDNAQQRLEKLEQAARIYEGLPFETAVPLLAALMPLPLPEGAYPPLNMTPEQQREATLDILNDWLTEEAERHPMLLLWEDLHWADPTTVEMLSLLIEQVPTVPMLVVGTFRPEFVPPWSPHSHITPITLSRLEPLEVESIVANVCGGKLLPKPVLEHIVSKADGVPLYVEELTKTILESDVLVEESDQYVLIGSLSDVNIPETLQDSLMARLDRTPTLREVAQLGAVIGREFAYEMLRHLVTQEEPALQDVLEQLVERELLYQRGRGRRARYMFKHALIQDAAYESLLKRTRERYHKQVANLLERDLPETVATHPELLAHHFTEAHETEAAIEYWYRAAELAKSRHAYQEASTHLKKGILLVNDLSDEQERARRELQFQFSLGGTYLQIKGHSAPEVEEAFARARELCGRIGDAPELIPTLFGLWRTYVVQMADIEKPKTVAAQILRLARENGDPVTSVVANYAVGFTALVAGEFVTAQQHLQDGIDLYSSTDRDTAEVYRFGQDPGVACYCYLALSEWALGYPDKAKTLAESGVDLAHKIDDPFSVAFAHAIGSFVHQIRGDPKTTATMAKTAISLSTENGFPYWKSIGSVMLAWTDAMLEATSESIDSLKICIADHRSLGTELFAGYFLTLLAEVALKGNERALCAAVIGDAENLSRQTGERGWESETLRVRGEYELEHDKAGNEARHLLERSLEVSVNQGAIGFQLRTTIQLARLLHDQGKNTDAHTLLAAALEKLNEGRNTLDVSEANALLNKIN